MHRASTTTELDQGAKSALNHPLCVDLDGTLIKSDILWESYFRLLRNFPLKALLAPFWLLKGKAHLKSCISDVVAIDITTLPYDEAVLTFIRDQRERRRQIVLATASNEKYARQVADRLGLFSEVFASSASVNLSADKKSALLVAEYGQGGFDYIGNSRSDRAVWAAAGTAIAANISPTIAAEFRGRHPDGQVLSVRQLKFKQWLRAIRPHQWVKNALVFVPLLVSHNVLNLPSVQSALLAFLAFTLCASSVYLINDLFDLEADRKHPKKKLRPLASGQLSIPAALVSAIVLVTAAAFISLLISKQFALILGAYVVLTSLYSLFLKSKVLVDVLLLAALYTIRIIAGAVAISVDPSFWLLAFSIFLFLSLALAKRYSELEFKRRQEEVAIDGRGYVIDDIPIIGSLGTASGCISVLVLALYINSDAVVPLYRHPEFLWLACPAMLYWISLVWFLAGRGKLNEDPVVFAMSDWRSLIVAAITVVFVLLGI